MKALLRQTAILALITLALSQANEALAHTGSGLVRVVWSTSFWVRGRPRPHVAQKAFGGKLFEFPKHLRASEPLQRGRAPWRRGALAAPVQADINARPLPPPARWRGLIGEYGRDNGILYILEKDGRLCALFKGAELEQLEEVSNNVFKFSALGSRAGQRLVFTRHAKRSAMQVEAGNVLYKRRPVGPEEGATQLRVKPLRPVSELLKEALAAEPPKENGGFRPPDLVELTKLDPTIKLEIRYATTNNLFGAVFYSQPRAFLQRPAAEALVRANRRLRQKGFGLLVHDAYRPWYVTRVFWDATPDDKKLFVADPSKGSRHNRGCAVDLTLFDLKTGKPVEMVSTYDETTDRAHPDYPGGTSTQRWHRSLLRNAMEQEGFTVYEAEWWHFDFKDWQKYPIGNFRFEQIGINRKASNPPGKRPCRSADEFRDDSEGCQSHKICNMKTLTYELKLSFRCRTG